VNGPYGAAVRSFMAEQGDGGWAALPFFRTGAALDTAARIDRRVDAGAHVLPPPGDIFNALTLTSSAAVRVVILGQDPYPAPGDAHGLAFSVRPGVAVPRSLRNICNELSADLGLPPPASGSLESWARDGVLLLNACLTVEAGRAGAHRGLGWEALSDQVIIQLSARDAGVVFMLWGADAQKKRPLIDESRHHVIATAHPSPLSARRGFLGSRPFSRANAWLEARGRGAVDWRMMTIPSSGRTMQGGTAS
jgi:uracil-DNA glycosylase